jgi:hypothetical protein
MSQQHDLCCCGTKLALDGVTVALAAAVCTAAARCPCEAAGRQRT